MPKRATISSLPEITLDTTLGMPLYKQLYGRLRGAILAGQLPRGERLPSTRTLASELGVSRHTSASYRFGGRPLEALQALDRAGRVLYIGTFSKLLFPSLRLGYLVAPVALVEPLLTTRRFTDVHLPILEQMVLADFLQEGHFSRHLRRMLQHYRPRRDCLHRELQTHLGDLLEVYVPQAGMELVGWLPPGTDDNRASDLAAETGIYAAPISRFSLEPLPRGGLSLGFANADEEQIRQGVKTLAVALRQL